MKLSQVGTGKLTSLPFIELLPSIIELIWLAVSEQDISPRIIKIFWEYHNQLEYI